MSYNNIKQVMAELAKAKSKFPLWPVDCVHMAAIVAEEAGELVQAALDYYYGRHLDRKNMIKEARHTAAMALRFLENVGSTASEGPLWSQVENDK